jgi:uncharacterized membrane protein
MAERDKPGGRAIPMRERSAKAPAVAAASARVPAIDGMRGIALCAMIAYHFAFDLRWRGVFKADFEHDPFWLAARTAILSSFLLLAGVSLVLADRANAPPRAFWRHVGIIAACALAVSVASYLAFPRTFIWFGVLHAIAVSLVLARPLVRRPRLALGVGTGIVACGLAFAHPIFDGRALGWLGFMTGKPPTEDYAPLFPWAGVLIAGIPLGHALARRGFRPIRWAAGLPATLRFAGRHSLAVYMIHQPLLLALLALLVRR